MFVCVYMCTLFNSSSFWLHVPGMLWSLHLHTPTTSWPLRYSQSHPTTTTSNISGKQKQHTRWKNARNNIPIHAALPNYNGFYYRRKIKWKRRNAKMRPRTWPLLLLRLLQKLAAAKQCFYRCNYNNNNSSQYILLRSHTHTLARITFCFTTFQLIFTALLCLMIIALPASCTKVISIDCPLCRHRTHAAAHEDV